MSLHLTLGIDSGCYEVKVVGPKGSLSFPSHVIVRPSNLKTFGRLMKSDNNFELTIDDNEYVLGEHALRLDKKQNKGFDVARGGSKNNESAFIRALGAVCQYLDQFEDEEEDEIIVSAAFGSPIINAVEEDEVKKIEERFGKKNGHDIIYNGKEYNIVFEAVEVLPEGAAAIVSQEFTEDQVYIVDAGSETVNFASMHHGVPIETETESLQEGVEEYKKSYGDKAPYQLARKIKSMAESLDWEEGSKLYICGGFANEIAEEFNTISKEDNMYIMDIVKPELIFEKSRKKKSLDPKFANAVGMFFLADKFLTTEG